MPSCVVKSCKNYSSKLKKPEGITFHEFPRNRNRKNDWVQIIRNCRGENDWNPSSASTVCSAHFDDAEFKTTAKGLRCLVPYAIPKKLLSNLPEIQNKSMSSLPIILQTSPNDRRAAIGQLPSPSASTISSVLQVPVLTEKALTGHCRLCATSDCYVNLVNLESDEVVKKLVVTMSNRLNINIEFSQEDLPKTICSACVKTLYTAYDFVVGIDLAQITLKNIYVKKFKYQMPENGNLSNNQDLSSTSLQQVPLNVGPATIKLEQPPLLESSSTIPLSLEYIRKRYDLKKKRKIIEDQKKKIKTLNQKVRRLQRQNESLKNILKKLKEKNVIDADLFNENTVAADLINNLNRKKLKQNIRYSKATNKFCLTLYHYSPRAYDYIRQSFDTCLPHRKTLAIWYCHSKGESKITEGSLSMTGEPEFIEESPSMTGEPEFTEESPSMTGEPEFSEESPSIKGEPMIIDESPSIKGEPVFTEESPSITSEPEFTEESPCIKGEPELIKDTPSIKVEPGFAEESPSISLSSAGCFEHNIDVH